MPKNSDLQKHTLNLYSGDYAKLQDLVPDIGAATIIRRIVHKFIQEIEIKGTDVDTKIHVEL